ncbi:lipid IV(A) 3-deoxy-D-manno-octulosonic acid transferase [Vibrio maritimus]|uniref:lipid IV(A) 3-deoxy-D-manno-octulosonic acid transferase n=1 Tax=Vibrio maritimus TaxID=990268 RepID=UPI001EFF83CA|nr:lipid IV(A) 3-deoxy-D-manno-octulosonic acid transferase [Vibrio maritimus]
MILRFVYTLLLTLVAPLFLYGLFKKKPGKPSVGKRWREHFGITPRVNATDKPIVWFHAVSVGETLAITPLIKRFAKANPDKKIIITTTTPTGAAQAEKLSDIAEHRYMPLDFGFAVKRFLRTVQPSHLIIVETELWPNTLHYVHQHGVSITVINARLSEKSLKNYQKIPSIGSLIFKNIDLLLCHSKQDAERFKALGVSEGQLETTGSIKYDVDIPATLLDQSKQLRDSFGSRQVWIAASTHKGEDEVLLDYHQRLLETNPALLLILVPRHPERFNDVYSLCEARGLKTVRRSTASPILEDTQVYLGDTMGDLLMLQGASDVCVMGGSLFEGKVGGHNVLEPAAMGTPCIIGPSYFNFKDIVEKMVESNAIELAVENRIFDALSELLANNDKQQQLAQNASDVVNDNKGAIDKSITLWRDRYDV